MAARRQRPRETKDEELEEVEKNGDEKRKRNKRSPSNSHLTVVASLFATAVLAFCGGQQEPIGMRLTWVERVEASLVERS